MKIGIFDSGVGGLLLLNTISKKLPQYDYVYLGDTKRVPYGNRSQETIYQFTKEAVEYLFKNNCKLVILACNTASTRALRRIQREYLPKHYSDRKVLGVIIPTVEVVAGHKEISRVGVLATQATVSSNAIVEEYKKLNSKAHVYQQAAPLLVPLIENNCMKWIKPILLEYLKPILKHKVQAILLGCTHYPILKQTIRNIVGKDIKVISQDELLPSKLKSYLERHPEIENKLGKNGRIDLQVTDLTEHYLALSKKWLGKNIKSKLIKF